MKFSLHKVLLATSVALFVVSCSKDCETQNGTLPDIDLTHLRPSGTYVDPSVTVDQQKMEYINDSTVVVAFVADNKTVKMTYHVQNKGTYASTQSKFK